MPDERELQRRLVAALQKQAEFYGDDVGLRECAERVASAPTAECAKHAEWLWLGMGGVWDSSLPVDYGGGDGVRMAMLWLEIGDLMTALGAPPRDFAETRPHSVRLIRKWKPWIERVWRIDLGPSPRDTEAVPRDRALPTSPIRERVAAIDVLRGVAVGGILLANVLVFFGLVILLPPDRAAALTSSPVDQAALLFEHVFVDGKFYSIFSLLFGIGFGVQLGRNGDAAAPRFRRRLRILLLIGAAHAVCLWAGDILMLYAMLGFLLPWFARRSDRQLLRWTVGLLATPTALYGIALGIWLLTRSGAPPTAGADSGEFPAAIRARIEAMGTGGIGDAFVGNLILLAGRWLDLFASMRFPKVLGMFVLGLWAARVGIATQPAAHRATLLRAARLGWGIGLPANLVAAFAGNAWPYLPPSAGGLLGVAAQAIGYPVLAIGYASTIALLAIDGRRIVSVFAPVGRMALTNYLMHSLVCVVLSYGFGFALVWRVGPAVALLIAVAIVAVQIPLSAWWLRRYQFGPMEWLWRRLTYRQALPMRRAAGQPG